jgi:predicted outer membrane repeat protein
VSNFTIENCSFESNSANNGGGLYAKTAPGLVRNCTFSGNSAKFSGGAIYTESSGLVIANSIFTGNSGGASGSMTTGGGAIFAKSKGPVITNCTFFGNRALFDANPGAAVYNFMADTRIVNSIFWGNSAAGNRQITDFPMPLGITEHCNIDQDGFEATNGNIRSDPLWVDPALGDFRLQDGSPCIDAGTEDLDELPDYDLDGNPRISGLTVDMGAFEFVED